MNRRGSGVLFVITGSILLVVRQLDQDKIAFGQMAWYVALVLLVAGIGYMGWGELTDD